MCSRSWLAACSRKSALGLTGTQGPGAAPRWDGVQYEWICFPYRDVQSFLHFTANWALQGRRFFFAVIARHCRRLDWWTTTLSTYIRLYSKVSSKKLFSNKVRITLVRISCVKFDKSNIVACSFAHFCREASSSKSIFFHYKANTVSPDSYIYIYLPTYLPTSFAWR